MKVRILSTLTTVGAAALVLPTLPGCASATGEATGRADDVTPSSAGAGVLSVRGIRIEYASTTGGDEFIRVGEKLKVAVDLPNAILLAAGSDDALRDELRADPAKLR